MDANELELNKYVLKTQRHLNLISLAGTAIKGIVWLLSIYLTLTGLQPFIGQDIGILAVVLDAIKKIEISFKISIGLNIILSILWWKERQGKRRAIRLKAKFQKKLEASDSFRSSSELSEIGTTPKEESRK